jgi:hypothetical protein
MADGSRRGTGLLRRALAAIGIGFGVGICAGTAGAGADAAEEVRQAGDYQLRTRILHAGTRSEGRIGRLFRHGTEVLGRERGEFIDVATPAGTVRFTYMGEARPHLWSLSGWTDRDVPR